jgi:predicted extracellular nuclease
VATFNVRNLSPVSAADTFAGLGDQIAVALDSPDLLALQEIQDDNGPRSDGTVSATLTYTRLGEAVADAGGPDYEVVEIAPEDGQDGGQPGGNIRVALAVRAGAKVSVVVRPGGTATTGTTLALDDLGPHLTASPGRLSPGSPAFSNSRKPLAVELADERGRLFVIVVHFVSKGADDPLFGLTQPPNASSSPKRTEQARVVADFASELLSLDASARLIVLGDFNAVAGSPSMEVLAAAGLLDLIATLPPTERYTHIYRGQGSALDHILVSPALRPDARCEVVHVNVEFSGSPSDHDPVAADLAWP